MSSNVNDENNKQFIQFENKDEDKKKNKKSKKLNKKTKTANNNDASDKNNTSNQVINELNKNEQNNNIDELINNNIKSAIKIWEDLKKIVRETPEYKEWEDKKKISYFRDTLKYKEFMDTYPVTSRYMICMGQFTVKAFKRFLQKLYTFKLDPIKRMEKGYTEDQWLRRQADYVRYLWEDYQKGHYNINHAQIIWQDAYQKLRGEMDDFRDKHKEIEKNVDEEKKKHKIENVKELLGRITGSEQKLSEADMIKLINVIKQSKKEETVPKPKEIIDDKTGIKTIIKSQPIYYNEKTGEYSQPIFENDNGQTDNNKNDNGQTDNNKNDNGQTDNEKKE